MCLYIVDSIVNYTRVHVHDNLHDPLSVTVDIKSWWEKWYMIFLWSMNYEIVIIQHNCEHIRKVHPIIFNNITPPESPRILV